MDKCHLSFKKKRDLRKHTDNVHKILKDSKAITNSDENNPNEVQGYSSKCTQETVWTQTGGSMKSSNNTMMKNITRG